MRALMDTSVFLWTISGGEQLSANARRFIAQSLTEQMPVITKDSAFSHYPAQVI